MMALVDWLSGRVFLRLLNVRRDMESQPVRPTAKVENTRLEILQNYKKKASECVDLVRSMA